MRLKDHLHTFVNEGGHIGALDFRMGGIGAPFNGLKAFATTEQLGVYDKLMNAVRLGTSPIVRALVDFDGGMDMVRDLDDITFSEWFLRFLSPKPCTGGPSGFQALNPALFNIHPTPCTLFLSITHGKWFPRPKLQTALNSLVWLLQT